jgi:hypothetical protein
MKTKILPLVILALSPIFANADGLLSYKPPKIDALQSSHVGGGTRSLGDQRIQLLAPTSVALSSSAQPVLYWNAALDKGQSIEVIVIEEGANEPLLEKTLSITPASGLKAIRLSDYGVSLQAGKKYLWSISTVTGSDNTVAQAAIIYQPSSTLSSLEQKAESGYWYDALQQLIENHSPQINNLVKQIGVTNTIDFSKI